MAVPVIRGEVIVAIWPSRSGSNRRMHNRLRIWNCQLRAFVAVATVGHFGNAARLHLTQPALSQRIQALENELGLHLLERSSREVRLTRAGKVLLPHAQGLVEAEDATLRDLKVALGQRPAQDGPRELSGSNSPQAERGRTATRKRFMLRYPRQRHHVNRIWVGGHELAQGP